MGFKLERYNELFYIKTYAKNSEKVAGGAWPLVCSRHIGYSPFFNLA